MPMPDKAPLNYRLSNYLLLGLLSLLLVDVLRPEFIPVSGPYPLFDLTEVVFFLSRRLTSKRH